MASKKITPFIGMQVLYHTTVPEFHDRNRGGAESHKGPYAGIVTKIHDPEDHEDYSVPMLSAIVFLDNSEQHEHVVNKPFFPTLEEDEHSGYFAPLVDPNKEDEKEPEEKPAKK